MIRTWLRLRHGSVAQVWFCRWVFDMCCASGLIACWIDGTPYEDGYFKVCLTLNEEYPTAPPKGRSHACAFPMCNHDIDLIHAGFFETKIFHPNVSADGEICVSTLKKDWKPELGITKVLLVRTKLDVSWHLRQVTEFHKSRLSSVCWLYQIPSQHLMRRLENFYWNNTIPTHIRRDSTQRSTQSVANKSTWGWLLNVWPKERQHCLGKKWKTRIQIRLKATTKMLRNRKICRQTRRLTSLPTTCWPHQPQTMLHRMVARDLQQRHKKERIPSKVRYQQSSPKSKTRWKRKQVPCLTVKRIFADFKYVSNHSLLFISHRLSSCQFFLSISILPHLVCIPFSQWNRYHSC